MKISHEKPPHFAIMHYFFKCDWNRTAFAFGDTVYSMAELPDHIIEHEKVHLDQQFHSVFCAWIWLVLYICSKRFRYKMELQAYRVHWEYFKINYRNTTEQSYFLSKIARDLSGKLYGNLVSYDEAIDAITKV